MIRILLADDHPLVRSGLSQLLSSHEDLEVVGTAEDGRQAISMAEALRPDVILMDLSMPVHDGISAIRTLAIDRPEIAVIALTTFQEPQQVATALKAGARGYLVKDVEPEVLIAGIRSVVRGGVPLSPSVAAHLVRQTTTPDPAERQPPTDTPGLTQREEQILRLIVSGRTNRVIADALGISEQTVKSHCGRLFQRIGVTDRAQAARWAQQHLPPR